LLITGICLADSSMESRHALARLEWLKKGGRTYWPKGRINLLKQARKAITKKGRNIIRKQNYLWKACNPPPVAVHNAPHDRPALFRQSAEHMCRISDPSLRRLYMTRCGYIDVVFRTLPYITRPYHGPGCGFPACHCEGPGSSRPAHVGLVELRPGFSEYFAFLCGIISQKFINYHRRYTILGINSAVK